MTGAVRQSAILRMLFCMAVALAFAARLLSPSGFMPVATSHGVMVTLCTGQGAVKMLVARDSVPDTSQHHDDSDHQKPMDHCPFAGAAGLPALPSLAALALLPVWHLPSGPIAFALRTGWIARLAAPPPPSSGPPATLD